MIQMMPNFWLLIYLFNLIFLMNFMIMNYFNMNLKKL